MAHTPSMDSKLLFPMRHLFRTEFSLLELLANAIPQIVWMADSEGNINYYNQAWYDLTGLTFEQTKKDGWKNAVHPNDINGCVELAKEAILTASSYHAEYRLWHAHENVYKWYLSRALPVKDEGGNVLWWIGTCTDIDAQKRKEETIEARFRAAIDITSDAICLLDRSTMRFIDCNDTACRMFGFSREELLRLGPSDIGPGEVSELEAIYDEIIANNHQGVTETIFRRSDGTLFPVEIQRQAMRSGDAWIMVLVARDITERIKIEKRVHQIAYHDQITGLPNRAMFQESLVKALEQAKKQRLTISVLTINLDRFKDINSTLGFQVADELLRQTGKRLINGLRIRDIVARLGSDDFGLILFNSEHSQGTANVANKVLDMLRQPFHLDGHVVAITGCVGIAVYPSDAEDADTLTRYADSAMHESKLAGGNVFRFHTAEMNARVLQKRAIQEALHKAIANDEFILHFQPRVHIESGKWQSVEALIRWNRPGHGLVPPAQFIPTLEETGLIVQVGVWVIKSACQQIRQWQLTSDIPTGIAVNVSPQQFLREGLVSCISEAIRVNEIDPALLEIEITESSLMSDAEKTIGILRELKALGVRISIDDFGTGYSSLAYLKLFPVDKLKIDMMFIREMTTNESDASITSTIIHLAHSLKLKVVAEGVETQEQLDFLRQRGCDEYQGYLFSKPLPADGLMVLRQSFSTQLF